MAKIKHTRNENGKNFTHQNKTTVFWRKKTKINLHQNFTICGNGVSYCSGGSWSTRIKQPTCRKSLKTLSRNVVSSTPRQVVIRNESMQSISNKINAKMNLR